MTVYLDLALALNFAVDLLLLIAANRLMGYPVRILLGRERAGSQGISVNSDKFTYSAIYRGDKAILSVPLQSE